VPRQAQRTVDASMFGMAGSTVDFSIFSLYAGIPDNG
jgi:hypothetical protein